MLATLLVASLATLGPAPVEFRPLPPSPVAALPAPVAATTVACDDGSQGGTLVQRQDHYYGNRFTAPCTAARIVAASFAHAGPALEGDATYRLHLQDGACNEVGVTPVLSTPAAGAAPAPVRVDLGAYGWCVEGSFALVLEPLRCTDVTLAPDCAPALVVDATSDAAAETHCAIVAAPTVDGRQCLAARSSDGRFFDFNLRVELECGASQCTAGVQAGTWSQVKRLYRDPHPATAD